MLHCHTCAGAGPQLPGKCALGRPSRWQPARWWRGVLDPGAV